MESVVAGHAELVETEGSLVYLYHLELPLGGPQNSQHYLGYCDSLKGRNAHHQKGTGARFTQVAVERNIKFELVKVWPGADRSFERRIKNQNNLGRHCPVCQAAKVVQDKVRRQALRQSKQTASTVCAMVFSFLMG